MFQYDYYDVEVYSDCADSIEGLADLAITEARERARLYCIPAIWSARLLAGGLESGDFVTYFRVCRKRHKATGTRDNSRGRTMGQCEGRGRPVLT